MKSLKQILFCSQINKSSPLKSKNIKKDSANFFVTGASITQKPLTSPNELLGNNEQTPNPIGGTKTWWKNFCVWELCQSGCPESFKGMWGRGTWLWIIRIYQSLWFQEDRLISQGLMSMVLTMRVKLQEKQRQSWCFSILITLLVMFSIDPSLQFSLQKKEKN